MKKMIDDETETSLRNRGYFFFVAIFTWPPEADKVARERFGLYFTKRDKLFEKTGMKAEYLEAYSLTGARTILVIGYTPDPTALYRYCSELMHDTGIEAKVYHAVETNKLAGLFPRAGR